MKTSLIALSALLATGFARPGANSNPPIHARDIRSERYDYIRPVSDAKVNRREVPQEHSHEKFLITVNTFLKLNNPDNIVDAVFGLLGNAAAAGGQGAITNTDCLQQATADQAFSNAKAANDVDGMTAALIYRALERNTGKVGLASVPCTAITAINPEIAAITQHQDPASADAAATNKAITIDLATQISLIGGDFTLALQSGTFAPGNINDPTAAGNTCDDLGDNEGCIFTKNLLIEDASVEELMAAVASKGAAGVSTSTVDAAVTTAAEAANTTVSECTPPPPPPPPPTDCAAAVSSETASATTSEGVMIATESGLVMPPTISSTSMHPPMAPTPPMHMPGPPAVLDLGSCPNPGIIFADGLDGRKESSFAPADESTFTHGSALNIKVITDFICQQLETKCKAPKDTMDACAKGAADAQKVKGQAAADAFNIALGISVSLSIGK